MPLRMITTTELMARTLDATIDPVAIDAALVAVRQAADAICDRWSLTLVLAMMRGERTFGGLMTATGMASRLLTARLRSLERTGIVMRMPYSVRPLRHDYHLTNKGESIFGPILHMLRWEQTHGGGSRRGIAAIQHVPCNRLLKPELRCGACLEAVTARDIALKVSRASTQHTPARRTSHRRSIVNSCDHAAVRQMLGPSLDIFGDKWGIEILVCAFFRVRRFGEFRDRTGISANILSDRLERLTAAGVLSAGGRGEAEPGYRLTNKGIDLYGVIVSIEAWADAWIGDRYRSPVRLIHRGCGAVFHPVTVCAHCSTVARRMDIAFT